MRLALDYVTLVVNILCGGVPVDEVEVCAGEGHAVDKVQIPPRKHRAAGRGRQSELAGHAAKLVPTDAALNCPLVKVNGIVCRNLALVEAFLELGFHRLRRRVASP